MYSKLESLRGVAACLVILFHSKYSFFDVSIRFVSNSYLFVDFFFIISGIVMSYAYAKKIENGLLISAFIALRLGRIYPLHVFMLFVFLLYAFLKIYLYSIGFGADQEFGRNNSWSFLSNLLLMHSVGVHSYLTWNSPSWSISVEFFTYIIFFLLIKSIDKNRGVVIPVILSIIGYSFLVGLEKPNLDLTYDLGLIRCIAAFYLGVVLFRVKPVLDKLEYDINLAEIASMLLVVVAISVAHKGWAYQFLLLTSFFISLLIFSKTESGFLGRILHSAPMRAIGIWSYSIYMVHYLVLSISYYITQYVTKMNPETISGPSSVLINIVIIFVVISISRYTYIYIEDKYRKLVKLKIRNTEEGKDQNP